jgi:hypothetical protein
VRNNQGDFMKKTVLKKKSMNTSKIKQEAAIKLQLKKIEQDYEKLVQDITKEYVLIRHWVMNQLDVTKDRLRSRMS